MLIFWIDLIAKSSLGLVLDTNSLFGIITYCFSVEMTISINNLLFDGNSSYVFA